MTDGDTDFALARKIMRLLGFSPAATEQLGRRCYTRCGGRILGLRYFLQHPNCEAAMDTGQ